MKTSNVTVESPGTWILKEMGDPLEGLGKGGEITMSFESVGV